MNIGQSGRIKVRDFESLLSELAKSDDIEDALKSSDAWRQALLAVDPDTSSDTDTTDSLSKVRDYIDENDLSEEDVISRLKKYESMTDGRPSKTKKWAQRINSGDATLEDAKDELPESTFYKLKREFDLE